jgi:uncharacterized protein (DUF1684 family)
MKLVSSIIILIFLQCCKSEPPTDAKYIDEINQWHQKRIERLLADNGWLNIVGRSWLKKGENKFGSAKDNDVVVESNKLPEHVGIFILQDTIVNMQINPDIKVFKDGKPISKIQMIDDQKPNMTVFELSSIKWSLIKRGNLFGVRFRDLESPLVKNFPGIERFPVSKKWKFTAKFQEYYPPKEIIVPNVLGQNNIERSPGAVIFHYGEKLYKIDALEEDDRLFLIFADKTSGEETYGGGRFIYVDKPDSNGNIILDFNKAFNPPCVFTKFATCPLPPIQNYLNLRIEAGEKNFIH